MVNSTTTSDDLRALVPLGGFGPRAADFVGDYPVATLVIGLGQVGWHAATLINNMFNAGSNVGGSATRGQSRVQCFTIARRPAVIPEDRLAREHCLLLSVEESDWTHVPGRYSGAGVARWWPKPPRDRAVVPDPTAIRCYGRLLLFDNPNLVNDTIQQRTAQLIQDSARPGSDGRRLIILVASIAEAEGSSLIFDVTSLLRTQLTDVPTTIVAILTADVNSVNDAGRTLAMANVYATLKELDAIMVNPAHYQLGPPVIDHVRKLTAAGTIRPFDYVLITGDAATNNEYPPPAAALAEMAVTWMLRNANRSEPPLPTISPIASRFGRFDGYTTFNISKLGLPTSAAIDVVASRLAQQILAGMVAPEAEGTTDDWVATTTKTFKDMLLVDKLFDEPKVYDRWHAVIRRTSSEAFTQEIIRNKDKSEFNLRQFGEELIQRLETENRTTELIDEGHTEYRLDTLRSRADDALDTCYRRADQQVAALATQLACLQGRSLRWTVAAFEKLRYAFNATLNGFRNEASKADRSWQLARRRVQAISQEYDERYVGIKRLLRGSTSKELTEVLQAYEQATQAMIQCIRWESLVIAWGGLWESLDKAQGEVRLVLQQVDRAAQTATAYGESVRSAISLAAQRTTLTFPSGALVDSEWFRAGIAQSAAFNDVPPERLTPRVFRQWATGRPGTDQRVDRFLRDLMPSCRKFLAGTFEFATLQDYLSQHSDTPTVRQGITDLQRAALPQWVPNRETTGWTAHEWLRRTLGDKAGKGNTGPLGVLAAPPGPPWQHLDIDSPDPDEACMIRLVHRITAESIEPLRGPYRRAYERVAAEGVPLHIDRRWDATLSDLIRNNVQSEVSTLWEKTLQAAAHGPIAVREPLSNLINVLAVALGIDPRAVVRVPTQASDFALTVFPLPTFRLRLPPPQCPIVFSFSTRRPNELGQSIYDAVAGLGLSEPFVFIVNVVNRRDMETVNEVLENESYNVVTLDEASFKGVVGARQPLSMLGDIVLSEVDLTLVSPFYTKAPVPERMFFGREREVKDVRRKIKTHSVALIGGRRIGKTSTLQHIERLLRMPDSSYVPYYLDCHNAMTYTHFFSSIARRWKIKTPTPDPTCFEDVVTEIKGIYPTKQIVFLFDEIDRLLLTDQEQVHSELLFRTFRALSNESRCQFIFSGERWLARAMGDSFSALFNFALPVPLAPLEKPVVARLVAEPFEMMNIWLEDANVLVNHIYEVSAGHPNIVQMICQEMVVAIDIDRSNVGLLNIKHLEHALEQHKLQEDIINTFWGQMSDLARVVTLVWPETQRHLGLDQIIDLLKSVGLHSVTIRDVQEAMKDLELYCFVTPKGRTYELVPVDFPTLLDEMTIKGLEIKSMVEKIMEMQKRDLFK